jgi:hypothetical protein
MGIHLKVDYRQLETLLHPHEGVIVAVRDDFDTFRAHPNGKLWAFPLLYQPPLFHHQTCIVDNDGVVADY